MSYIKQYAKDAPKSCQGKPNNAKPIAQVWCPATKYKKNQDIINGIVASLELEKQ